MKTSKQLEVAEEKKTKSIRFAWRIALLCIPVIMAIVILINACAVKDKIARHHRYYESYDVRDAALFVAMPLLKATIK